MKGWVWFVWILEDKSCKQRPGKEWKHICIFFTKLGYHRLHCRQSGLVCSLTVIFLMYVLINMCIWWCAYENFCRIDDCPNSKVHGANMGPTWVLSAPGGLHVGPINLAIWMRTGYEYSCDFLVTNITPTCHYLCCTEYLSMINPMKPYETRLVICRFIGFYWITLILQLSKQPQLILARWCHMAT